MSLLPTHTSRTPLSFETIQEMLAPIAAPPTNGWMQLFNKALLVEMQNVDFLPLHQREKILDIFESYFSSLAHHGFNVSLPIPECNNTPLCIAAALGCVATTFCLIEFGAPVNNGINGTPLWWACYKNQFNTAELLISHGADVNQSCRQNQKPIHITLSFEIMHLLVQNGARINITSDSPMSYTPLHWAVRCANANAVDALLEMGWKDVPNQENETALAVAYKIQNGTYKTAPEVNDIATIVNQTARCIRFLKRKR